MRKLFSSPTAIVALIFTVGVIICSLLWTRALVRARSGDELIRVVGSARKAIRSDFIIWNGSISKTAPTVARGYAQIRTKMAMVRAYLKRRGVPDKDMTVEGVSVETLYLQARTVRRPDGTIVTEPPTGTGIRGYKLSQGVEIHSSKVDIVENATCDTSQLLEQGVLLDASAPTYLYTRTSELKVSMQAEAARDALNRAQAMAQNAGCRLGAVRFARMMTPSITPYYANTEDDGGMDDTTALNKKITAIVVVGYAIK
jgi:hypothetical protein